LGVTDIPRNSLKNWDDIRLLLAVAECGGISGAADELQLKKDTVMRRLDDLEDLVGRRLFRRLQRRGSVPTAACDLLLERARAVREAIGSFDQSMAAIRALDPVVSVSAPPGVLHFTLVPALLKLSKTLQPFDLAPSSYPLPAMTFSTEGDADVSVTLTSTGDIPGLKGDITVRRVGTMRFAPFAPRASAGVARVHKFRDLRDHGLFQRTDYATVPSMAAWNDLCLDSASRAEFINSVDMYSAFKQGDSVSIFPSYSSMYDPEAVRLELDDEPEISLSVWMSSRRDTLKEPAIRTVFDAVAGLFATSPWFS